MSIKRHFTLLYFTSSTPRSPSLLDTAIPSPSDHENHVNGPREPRQWAMEPKTVDNQREPRTVDNQREPRTFDNQREPRTDVKAAGAMHRTLLPVPTAPSVLPSLLPPPRTPRYLTMLRCYTECSPGTAAENKHRSGSRVSVDSLSDTEWHGCG